MLIHERYVTWLSRYFFCPGWTEEDLAQEARLAMWLSSPGAEKVAARRRLITIVNREVNQRPQFWPELDDAHHEPDMAEIIDRRDRIRLLFSTPLSEIERVALGRAVRGEPCSEKRLDNALHRAKTKLREAA